MLKSSLFAALFVIAAPAAAQQSSAPPAPAAGPQAAIQQAAMAFGQCIEGGVQALDAAVAPEAGATSVLGGCSTHLQALQQAVEALIATLPPEQQAMAQEQLRTQLAGLETDIAGAIRRQRGGAAPAPAPTPE